MINARAIDHVCLWVSSLSAAREYYEKLFGLVCTPRKDDNRTLIAETESIHFFISEAGADTEFLSRQHLSFEVASISKVIENLDALGITGYETGEVNFFVHRNYKWCEWRDPDGIRLECIERI